MGIHIISWMAKVTVHQNFTYLARNSCRLYGIMQACLDYVVNVCLQVLEQQVKTLAAELAAVKSRETQENSNTSAQLLELQTLYAYTVTALNLRLL